MRRLVYLHRRAASLLGSLVLQEKERLRFRHPGDKNIPRMRQPSQEIGTMIHLARRTPWLANRF